MHSFNELNLLDSIEVRELEVCEVCQITQNPFHTTKQIHSLWPKTVCGLRNSCLSKSSVLNLKYRPSRSSHMRPTANAISTLRRALIILQFLPLSSQVSSHQNSLCSPKLRVHVFQRTFPLNCFSLICSTMTETPSQTHSTDGWHGACEDMEGLSSF